MVGPLQSILARFPAAITGAVPAGIGDARNAGDAALDAVCGVARAPASIIGSRRKVDATVDFSAVLAGEVSRQSRSVQNRHRTSREIRHELAGWMGGYVQLRSI